MYYTIKIDDADHAALAQAFNVVAPYVRKLQMRQADNPEIAGNVMALSTSEDHAKLATLSHNIECLGSDFEMSGKDLNKDPYMHVLTLRMKAVVMNVFARAISIEKLAEKAPDKMITPEMMRVVAKYDGLEDSALVKIIQHRLEKN